MKGNKIIIIVAIIIATAILAVLAITFFSGENAITLLSEKYREEYVSINSSEYISEDEVPEELKRYVLGADLQGRLATEILQLNDSFYENITLIAEESTIPNPNETIKIITTDTVGKLKIWYFKYNGVIYRAGENLDTFITDKDFGVQKIRPLEEGTKVGKYVKYDNQLWCILYDDEKNGLQMISENVLKYNEKNFYLGYDDTSIENWNKISSKVDIDKNRLIAEYEKSIYSYNNAIKTLNTICENLVSKSKIITQIRCVGSNPRNKDNENKKLYSEEELSNWPENDAKGIGNNIGKSADTNYESDFVRMVLLGINQATYGEEANIGEKGEAYWLASRTICNQSGRKEFNIHSVLNNGAGKDYNIWYIDNSGIYGEGDWNNFRPVIVLKTDTKFTGEGTRENPFVP